MKVTLMDKTLEIEDYEVLVKSTKDGTLVASVTAENVFSIEFNAADTRRLTETFASAIKILATTACHQVSPEDVDLHKVTLGPLGCQQ